MKFTVEEGGQRETNNSKLNSYCVYTLVVFSTRSSDPVDCHFIEYLIT